MKTLCLQFCARALDGATTLPTAERADFFDLAGDILEQAGLPSHATAARTAATDLRNAEAAQARFDALLNAALDMNSVQ